MPLGNIGSDWWTDIADALFARALREARHLLWVVDASLPDISGSGDSDSDAEMLLWKVQLPTEVCTRFLFAAPISYCSPKVPTCNVDWNYAS